MWVALSQWIEDLGRIKSEKEELKLHSPDCFELRHWLFLGLQLPGFWTGTYTTAFLVLRPLDFLSQPFLQDLVPSIEGKWY